MQSIPQSYNAEMQCILNSFTMLVRPVPTTISLYCSTMSTKYNSPQDTKTQRHNFRAQKLSEETAVRSQKVKPEGRNISSSPSFHSWQVGKLRWQKPPLSGCKIGRHKSRQNFERHALGLCQHFNSSRSIL